MSIEDPIVEPHELCKYLDDMTSSLSSVRGVVQSLKSKSAEYSSNKDGISLLSLKHHVLLSYLQSLVLVTSRRALGHSLSERTPPPQPFSDSQRSARGDGCGDLVDQMIEGRIVLEKVKALEGRMRYQIEKLVKAAQKSEKEDESAVINDPLAFRPNPRNLVDANDEDNAGNDGSDDDRNRDDRRNEDGIYRPPRVAPMPYVPQTAKSKRQSRAPIPTSLATLLHTDGAVPHAESTSGLGSTPALNMVSSRARYLKRLSEFEEEQFGRVMMNKKESRRRRRDEEDMALGGGLTGVGEEGKGSRRRRTAGGWEDEFGDVLKDVERGSNRGFGGDGYEELRQKGKRASVLERSRDPQKKRNADILGETDGGAVKARKRSRFELERKGVKKRRG